MGHVDFIEVHIRACICYIFLLLCFLGPVKEPLIKKFRWLLVAFVIWVTGSLCMRLQVPPGIKFWYDVSLCGLFCLPVCYYYIFSIYTNSFKRKTAYFILAATVLLNQLNITSGVILPAPKLVEVEGNIRYTYHVDWGITIVLIPVAAYLILMGRMVYRVVHDDRQMAKKLLPFFAGLICILIGNMAMMIPGNTFPYDILSGLVNVFLIAYMLYKGRLFEIRERVVVGIIYGICAVCVILAVYNIDLWLYNRIVSEFGSIRQINLIIITMFSMVLGIAVTFLANFLVEHYVLQQELGKINQITSFQNQISSELQEESIVKHILDVLIPLTEGNKVSIVLFAGNEDVEYFEKGGFSNIKELDFTALNPLFDTGKFFCHIDNTMLEKLEKSAPALSEWILDNKVSDLGRLVYRDNIQGYVFIECKKSLSNVRAGQLVTVLHSASGGIRNAQLYKKVYLDSITDELTGAYNRKYALQRLREMGMQQISMTVLHLDIDDFKIYNSVYGTEEGDELIKWCAHELRNRLGEKGEVFRYGIDEFLIIMPDTDMLEILEIGKGLQKELEEQAGLSEQYIHYVSISGGAAACPMTARTPKEALHQAEMTTNLAKRTGIGKIQVYNEKQKEENWNRKSYDNAASTIYALTAAIDAKDNYTFIHSQNVSEYAVKLAEKIGYNSQNVEIIKVAGLLHDIGKISIPESILKKSDKLTEEEYHIMQKHVLNSIDVIRYLPGMDYVIPAVVGHHEKYDGTGYPRGLSGESIPESARILAIADCFDAMTAKRPYKEPFSIEYAIEELERCKGKHFDPVLTDAFITLIKDGEISVSITNN